MCAIATIRYHYPVEDARRIMDRVTSRSRPSRRQVPAHAVIDQLEEIPPKVTIEPGAGFAITAK